MLLCPKPHVAPWRVDVVSLTHDCYRLENGIVKASALCHIQGQSGLLTPAHLTKLDQIKKSFPPADPTTGEPDDEAVRAATQSALTTAQPYAELLKPDLAHFHKLLIDKLAIDKIEFDNTQLLSVEQKNTLVLDIFLREQVQAVRGSNFAGSALLFTGVLEQLARNTIFIYGPSSIDNKDKTLGGLFHHRQALDQAIKNTHWQKQVSQTQVYEFFDWLKHSKDFKELRNIAAHEAHLDETKYEKLEKLYFGGTGIGYGLLNGFLKAWKP